MKNFKFRNFEILKLLIPAAVVLAAIGAVGFQIVPTIASVTDRSGTIAAGGTSQTLVAQNQSRRRVIIQNPCTAASQGIGTAENLFLNFTAAATTAGGNSLELQPCGSFDTGAGPQSTEKLTVIAATTGHQYVAKEYY